MHTFSSRFLSGTLLFWLLAYTANASILMQTVNTIDGDAIQVNVSLNDAIHAGKIQITVAIVPGPNTGDLRGLWLNISDDSLLPGLSVINGPEITQSVFSGSVGNLGGGANLNGSGPSTYDMGFKIGTPGIGGDDIQLTTFTVAHNTQSLSNSLFAFEGVGVRVTSVGPVGSSRNGSSKLRGDFGGVPEPVSLLVWCGLAIAFGHKRP